MDLDWHLVLGATLIILWARADLDSGLPQHDFQFRTFPDRRFIGYVAYCLSLLMFFLVLYSFTTIDPHFIFCRANDAAGCGSPHPRYGIGSLVALLILMGVLPNVPLLDRWLSDLRSFCRALALYPQGMTQFMGSIRREPSESSSRARSSLLSALERYDVPWEAIRTEMPSAFIDRLVEIQQVRDSVREFENTTPNRGVLLAYVAARSEVFQMAETSYQRLIRLVAKMVCLGAATESADHVADADTIADKGTILAELADRTLERYRQIFTEIAISCYGNQSARTKLASAAGYIIPSEPNLPYWTLVLVLVTDAALLLLAAVPGIGATGTVPMPRTVVAIFVLGHCFTATICIACAIFPKRVGNFARPTPYSYPWKSYLTYGLLSYGIGVVFNLLSSLFAFQTMNAPGHNLADQGFQNWPIWLPPLVFSLHFPVMTTVVSFRSDVHLRHRKGSPLAQRVWDALILGSALLLTNVGTRAFLHPPTHIFLYIYTVLGIVVGFSLPVTVAAYLNAAEEQRMLD
jgi:hypothetical protein